MAQLVSYVIALSHLVYYVYTLSGATLLPVYPTLLILGGFEKKDTNFTFFDTVQALDISQTFSLDKLPITMTPLKLPKPISYLVPLGRKEKIYLLGGSTREGGNTKPNSDIYLFDMAAKTIQATGKSANMGYKSSVSTLGYPTDFPYAINFGGFDSASSSITTSTSFLSDETGKAEASILPNSPSSRQLSSMTTFNTTHLILTGGYQDTPLNDIYFLQLSSRTWSKSTLTLLEPRYSHKTLILGNRFILSIGGQAQGGSLLEYVDLSSFKSKVANIVNKNEGPDTFIGGSVAYIQQDLILLVGASFASGSQV
ncbi:hypothetical protein HMI55_006752 [Coelomomyces lativittatus]|nr:hypothetical protein HMI55_006752 [Coelomomyces lativittatus]